MLNFKPYLFEVLKQDVLKAAGITNVLPADCRTISELITLRTRSYISPTTIKRVYGFAQSSFAPSMSTLDALARFCGAAGWSALVDSHTPAPADQLTDRVDWAGIRQSAYRMSSCTLEVLQARSGLPFQQTIRRDFLDDHMEFFLQEGKTATAIIAPGGYGKTIALCHWVRKQRRCDDAILFISGSILLNECNGTCALNQHLASLMGYGADSLANIMLAPGRSKERFFLVIDGLDDLSSKTGRYQALLGELIGLIDEYRALSWFKVILTLRTASWSKNRQILDKCQAGWFLGFSQARDRPTNVPLFDRDELGELCKMIDPYADHNVTAELVDILGNPTFFQLYQRFRPVGSCASRIAEIAVYDAMAAYVLDKIFLGPLATEKVLLIRELITVLDLSYEHAVIPVHKICGPVGKYKAAYDELIAQGYLRASNADQDDLYGPCLEFANIYLLGHAVAQAVLSGSCHGSNDELVQLVNSMPANDRYKTVLLKWCVRSAVKNGSSEDLCSLADMGLPVKVRCELGAFKRELSAKNVCGRTICSCLDQLRKVPSDLDHQVQLIG